MSALEFMLLEQQQQNPTNTLIMVGLGIGVLALMFFFISGSNPLNIFKGLFTGENDLSNRSRTANLTRGREGAGPNLWGS